MNSQERLNNLYKKYGLTSDDVFKSPQGWKIITRTGIDKIQVGAKITIKYDLFEFKPDVHAYIKATGTIEDGLTIETYGEASSPTTKNKYIIAIAEKRAMSRVVLKLSGFYQEGFFGEDEWDDASKEAKKVRKEPASPKGFNIQKEEEINDDLDFDTL